MDTIFMSSKNSKTSDSHRLLLNLTDKIDWRLKIFLLYMERYEKAIWEKWILNISSNMEWWIEMHYFEYVLNVWN